MQQLDDFTVFLRQALINCANPTIVVSEGGEGGQREEGSGGVSRDGREGEV